MYNEQQVRFSPFILRLASFAYIRICMGRPRRPKPKAVIASTREQSRTVVPELAIANGCGPSPTVLFADFPALPCWQPFPDCDLVPGRAVVGAAKPGLKDFCSTLKGQNWGSEMTENNRHGVAEALHKQCVP